MSHNIIYQIYDHTSRWFLFAQIQNDGSCIEFLIFLLRNHQINFGKEVQVSDRNYDILVLFR